MGEEGNGRRATSHAGCAEVVIAMAVIAILVGIVVLLPVMRASYGHAHSATTTNNLRQLGILFKMYSEESAGGKFPPITPYPDVWMFDVRSVYPEYISDLSILVSPNLPDAKALRKQLLDLELQRPTDWETITRIAARSYVYVPWAIHDISELKQLSEARKSIDRGDLDNDIEYDGKTFYRLREGVERHFTSDVENPDSSPLEQSQLLTVFDATLPNVKNPRRWILYTDGHVNDRVDRVDLESLLK